MSRQEAVAVRHAYQTLLDQSIKPTFAALSEVIVGAANSVSDGNGGPLVSAAFEKLRDQLFLSPRLTQWQFNAEKPNRGFWLKPKDLTLTVTVREDKVILSCPDSDNPRYPFNYDVVTGLPAATLFKSIQDAQAIVQSHISSTEDGEDFFKPDSEEPYFESAGLDAALEETHSEPLAEDDAELIEEVTAEQALDADQRQENGLEPIVTVSQMFINDITENKPESFTEKTNRKNATTDGVECEWCGNFNRDAYKGTCPKCPKQTKEMPAVLEHPTPKSKDAVVRFKSLQGRILTIIDGTFSDKTQREAVKQMINKEFRREITKAGE